MSSLPNEIFSDVTNFLPNDDITDLMLMSKTFNALVTPRLKKINQEMSTMDQSIKSFMPSPAPDPTDCKWISQLNLKRFEPIGSEASVFSLFVTSKNYKVQKQLPYFRWLFFKYPVLKYRHPYVRMDVITNLLVTSFIEGGGI
ncbi:hypothetical protein Ddc_15113 [Ditylenchus destructor]|nr:hypothetical protein Ddc_15113 [Ditylenchus destructor]